MSLRFLPEQIEDLPSGGGAGRGSVGAGQRSSGPRGGRLSPQDGVGRACLPHASPSAHSDIINSTKLASELQGIDLGSLLPPKQIRLLEATFLSNEVVSAMTAPGPGRGGRGGRKEAEGGPGQAGRQEA